MQDQATSSLPSSSERSSSSAPQMEVKEGLESDEEIRRVPEFGVEQAGPSTSGRETGSGAGSDRAKSSAPAGRRKRGRSPVDKEHKRLKRLLRNRVSAQQARERKKAYLNDLEAKVKDLEKKNSEMEERLSTLQNENRMLRQVQWYVGEKLLRRLGQISEHICTVDEAQSGIGEIQGNVACYPPWNLAGSVGTSLGAQHILEDVSVVNGEFAFLTSRGMHNDRSHAREVRMYHIPEKLLHARDASELRQIPKHVHGG